MKKKKEIEAYIISQKDSFISDLKRLVDIKSVRESPLDGKPFGEGPARALAEAQKIAASHGFNMVNMENYAGEINFGPEPALMLMAHLDVVEAGDFWTREPYNMTVEGDKLYGRGTTDDKGAALACLYALKAVREIFGEPERGVRLVMGCGEETGSEDMAYYFSKRKKLEFTLSPDANYPVINLEKGRFAPVFYKYADNCGEKTVIEFKGGTTANIAPGRAQAAVRGISVSEISAFAKIAAEKTGASFSVEENNGLMRINAFGIGAHAAHPEKGNNAQTALLYLLSLLPLNKNALTSSLNALYSLFPHSDTCGGAAGVKMADKKSGALTLNFGVLNFENERLCGTLDLRCPLCANEANVGDVLVGKLKDRGFIFEEEPKMIPAHYVSEDSLLIKTVLKVYEEFTGNKGECLAIGGSTYVHGIEGAAAFGTEFPGKNYHIHGADEFAVVDELLLTAEMYAAVIYELSWRSGNAASLTLCNN